MFLVVFDYRGITPHDPLRMGSILFPWLQWNEVSIRVDPLMGSNRFVPKNHDHWLLSLIRGWNSPNKPGTSESWWFAMMNQAFQKNNIFCVSAYLCAFCVVCGVAWSKHITPEYTRCAFVCARLHVRAFIYAYRVYVKPTPINLWLLQNRSKQHDQESSCKWIVFSKVTR